MKKFIVQLSHIEYAAIEIMANDKHEAERSAFEKIDNASWGNDETEIIDTEEVVSN